MKKVLFYLILLLTRLSSKFKEELILMLKRIKNMLKTESKESKRMLDIYFNYHKGHYTEEDIKWANNQLKDVFKAFGVGAILILPFAPITLPFLVKLSERLGINILPDSFKVND